MKKSFLTGIAMIALVVFPSQVFAADATTLQTQLMTYLPYILIGGAVILLISIVGILLSKRKEKGEEEITPSVTPVVENATPVTFTPEVQTPVQPVNMDNISSNLYAPAEAKPTIQETMESNTPTEELPLVQPEFAPSVAPVTEQTQSSDLQDILQGEASASPMGPVTDNASDVTSVSETPVEPVISSLTPNPIPTESPIASTLNTPVPEVAPAIPDLQQFINNQVAEVPPTTAPAQDLNPTSVDTTTPTQTGAPFSI